MGRNKADEDQDFDAFFLDVSPRVLALAYRITASRQDAEDIAIEAFTRAYVRWARLDKAAWRNGWIVTVATNLALDALRKRSLHQVVELTDSVDIGTDRVDEIVEHLSLIDDIKTLPRRQRQVTVLVHGLGMSYAEAAMTLGVSIGATKNHLHRATTKLRRLDGPTREGRV